MKQDDWDTRTNEGEEYTSSIHQRTEELYRIPDSELDENGCVELSVLVLRDIVVFPRMISPIFVTPGSNLLAIQDAQYNFQTMISLVQRDSEQEDPSPEDLLSIGAVDFGILVDGAVVMVENILRHLAHKQRELGRELSSSERLQEVGSRVDEAADQRIVMRQPHRALFDRFGQHTIRLLARLALARHA